MEKYVIAFLNQNIFFDEAEDDEEYIMMLQRHLSKREGIGRLKIRKYYEEVIPRYLNDDFKSHFRVERTTIEFLIVNLSNVQKATGKPPLPLEKQILITLWYLVNQEVFRTIADRFDVTKSTAHEVIYRIIDGLIDIRQQFIKWPTADEARKIMGSFQNKNGFPNVIGCIDGSHIPILTPQQRGDSYVNRKGFHSLILQGICDDQKQFLDVSVGWPGSMHDSRVLRRSDFGQKMLENPNELFYGDSHLLGDSAYPLSTYILTPYRDNGHLTRRQKNFNRKLSSLRIIIEHAFGLLKTRFRILKFLNILNTVNIPKVILACCILHNICIQVKDDIRLDEELLVHLYNLNLDVEGQNVQHEDGGVEKRNYIASIV